MSDEYPEHEKLKAKEREALTIGSFIDFLSEQGWEIAEWNDEAERLWSIRKRPEEIIGLYLRIDPKKLEAEKQAMLKAIRADNPRTKARVRP